MSDQNHLGNLPENVVGALIRHRIKGRPSEGGAEWVCSCDAVDEFDTAEEHIARVALTANEANR